LFTGIVEDLGEVETVEHLGDFARIHVRSTVVAEDARPGDSICVSGVCLTVTAVITSRPAPAGTAQPPPPAPLGFAADVMGETLARSSLKSVAPGTKVNLERSVRLADRLGGHLVQGHVDGTATIVSRDPQEQWEVVRISLPADLGRYVVHKGSVTVDGVSLTVSAIGGNWFEVSLIPETLKRTTLGAKQPGAEVNLEVDVIAKYVEKLLSPGAATPGAPPDAGPMAKTAVLSGPHPADSPWGTTPRTPRGAADETAGIPDMRTGGTG
jgi:riboflavin synthase